LIGKLGQTVLDRDRQVKGADYRALTDTGSEVGAARNKSLENLICTLETRDPRQTRDPRRRAAINDFIGELPQRAAEVGLEVAILRESPPKNVQQCVQRFVQHGPLLDLQVI
jgi:hypothetical protein